MSGGQLAVCASNNHHRHLTPMVPHHRQGDDGQSGEDVVIKNSIKYFSLILHYLDGQDNEEVYDLFSKASLVSGLYRPLLAQNGC